MDPAVATTKHSTVHPKQVEYNNSLLKWIHVFVEKF